VSFISSTLVLPVVLAAVGNGKTLESVILVKPQFEVGRENVGKGGIVRDSAAHQFAIERVRSCVVQLQGESIEIIASPIHGAEGNKEFLLHTMIGH